MNPIKKWRMKREIKKTILLLENKNANLWISYIHYEHLMIRTEAIENEIKRLKRKLNELD